MSAMDYLIAGSVEPPRSLVQSFVFLQQGAPRKVERPFMQEMAKLRSRPQHLIHGIPPTDLAAW